MRLGKTSFFLLLAGIIILPFFVHRLIWLAHSVKASGIMCFQGKTLNGQFDKEYPVISFYINDKRIFFNGTEGAKFNQGDTIAVRYQKNNPAEARIDDFSGIWLDTVINAAVPFLLLLMLYLHRGIVPWGSSFVIGKKPFVQNKLN